MTPVSFSLIVFFRFLLLITGSLSFAADLNAGPGTAKDRLHYHSPACSGEIIPAAVRTNAGDFLQEGEIAVITRFEVKQGHQHKIRKLIGKYVRQANRMKENIMAEAFYEQDSASILWVIERWSSRNAFDKSRSGKKYKLLQSLASAKLVQSPVSVYVKDLEPLSKEQWRVKAGQDDQPITIMLFVDSRPGTEKTFQTVYHTAMPQFRSEPGVINYQLSQLYNDSTQFVTYEKFRNEAAFQYHLQFPPIQPVIDYLNTSIRKQPFQLGLHRLVEFAPAKRK